MQSSSPPVSSLLVKHLESPPFSLLPQELMVVILSNLRLEKDLLMVREVSRDANAAVRMMVSEISCHFLVQQLALNIIKTWISKEVEISTFIRSVLLAVREINMPLIKKMALYMAYEDEIFNRISSLVEYMPNIEEVSCAYCGRESDENCAALLALLDKVKKVNISGIHGKNILNSLSEEIEVLDYQSVVQKTDVADICAAFTRLNQLKIVNISNNKSIDEKALKSLSTTVEVVKCQFLGCSDPWKEDMVLGEGLSHLTTLSTLDIQGMALKGSGLSKISQTLQSLSCRECKRLEDTDFAQALASLSNLKKLDISDTRLNGKSLFSLSKTVEVLYLADCKKLGDDTTSFVSQLSALKKLDISGTKLTGDSLRNASNTMEIFIAEDCKKLTDDALKSVFGRLTNLKKLDINGTTITGEALLNLSQRVEKINLASCENLTASLVVSALNQLPNLAELLIGNGKNKIALTQTVVGDRRGPAPSAY